MKNSATGHLKTFSAKQEQASFSYFFQKLQATLNMIKVAHTIFALPFAFLGWIFGQKLIHEAARIEPQLKNLEVDALHPLAQTLGMASFPWLWSLFWVLIAMIGARSFAMAFNRIADAKIDALNPRTASRELPAGTLSLRFVWFFTLAMALLFILASAMLNTRALILAPLALFVVATYSYTKRFTIFCHLVLGLGLAFAPIGAWVAALGGAFNLALDFSLANFNGENTSLALSLTPFPGSLAFQPVPLLLGLGVLFWVAGFDILYALQDLRFDKKNGLHSIPAKLGKHKALLLARLFHVLAWCSWLASILLFRSARTAQFLVEVAQGSLMENYAPSYQLGFISFLALGIVAGCLIYEHSLIKNNDLSRLNAAFFTMNGIISIIFVGLLTLDLYV